MSRKLAEGTNVAVVFEPSASYAFYQDAARTIAWRSAPQTAKMHRGAGSRSDATVYVRAAGGHDTRPDTVVATILF